MEYENMCNLIIEAVGGKENIVSARHCTTRLRLILKNQELKNDQALSSIDGVLKVNQFQNETQIVIGPYVNEVYDTFVKISGLEKEKPVEEDLDSADLRKKVNPFVKAINAVSEIMMTVVRAIIAFCILRGLTIMFGHLGVLDMTGDTYNFLINIGNTVLYFLPILVAYSAARYFRTNIPIAITLACCLFNPTISSFITEGNFTIFGFINIESYSYTGTIIPAILMVWFQYYVEKIVNRISPKSLRSTLVPLVSAFVVAIATFTVIGPVGVFFTNTITDFFNWLYSFNPFLFGILMGGTQSLLVVVGIHTSLGAIAINNIGNMGYDFLLPACSCANFGQIGALYATIIKSKNINIKTNAINAAIANAATGFQITEPIIYGSNLVLKTPFLAGLIGGAVGGGVGAILGAKATGMGAFTLFMWPNYIEALPQMIIAIIVSIVIGFVVNLLIKNDEMKKGQ